MFEKNEKEPHDEVFSRRISLFQSFSKGALVWGEMRSRLTSYYSPGRSI